MNGMAKLLRFIDDTIDMSCKIGHNFSVMRGRNGEPAVSTHAAECEEK